MSSLLAPATNGAAALVAPLSVIVTGGASGIGLAMARHFAAGGHAVAILDVDAASGPAVAAQVAAECANSNARVTFHRCDVSSWDEQAAVFRRVYDAHGGRLDVVLANAGISERGATSSVDLSEAEPSKPRLAVLDVNLTGCIYSVKLAAHYMNKKNSDDSSSSSSSSRRQSRGSIVCTASNAGLYPFPTSPLYAASKAGVINLVRSLARHLEKANIQINALAPAVLETNIAPDKALFKHMVITPMSTLTRGVAQLVEDPTLSGAVAEIHGESVTIRPPHDYVDEDTARNLERFWTLGYA